MKFNKVTKASLSGLILMFGASSYAAPVMWETDFGTELVDLTGEDDAFSTVSLSFMFPYAGESYNEFAVGTNGGIQATDNLGLAGNDDDIDYDLWADLDEFLGDGTPLLSAFGTDLSLEDNGTIHFNDFGDRAVFTWNEVGSALELDHLASFQIQLFEMGQILFSYNGIFDDAGESPFDSLDEGIVTGISAGDFGPLALQDLSSDSSNTANTVFEQWCYDTEDSCEQFTGLDNSAFDLDQMSILFTPNGNGFDVSTVNQVSAPSSVLFSSIALLGLAFAGRKKLIG